MAEHEVAVKLPARAVGHLKALRGLEDQFPDGSLTQKVT